MVVQHHRRDIPAKTCLSALTAAGAAIAFAAGAVDVEFGFAIGTSTTGSTNSPAVNSIEVDSTGNVYATGFFEGTVDFEPGAGVLELVSTTNWDMFVAKYDPDGGLVWVKGFGVSGGAQDIGWGIAIGPSGNVHVAGKFHGTVDFDPGTETNTLTSAGSTDAFLLKLDSNGNYVWAKSMGGTAWDECLDIAVDESGNVYTTGNFQNTADLDPGAGVANFVSAGFYDVFVQKLDASGDLVWAKQLGGAKFDQG